MVDFSSCNKEKLKWNSSFFIFKSVLMLKEFHLHELLSSNSIYIKITKALENISKICAALLSRSDKNYIYFNRFTIKERMIFFYDGNMD